MKTDSSRIYADLKNLISNYFTDKKSEVFIKSLEENLPIADLTHVSELDKSQMEYELPKGTGYRLVVDSVITYSEKNLPSGKFYMLLLDLSQLMFFAGENSFSLEIAEYLLSKVKNDDNQLFLRGKALWMISKVYWAQAYWDDSEYYAIEAQRIFQSISSSEGLANCENIFGGIAGEKGEFDKAKIHFNNALNYLNNTDDLQMQATILNNLGIINTAQGDYQSAIWNHKNSVEKFEKLGNTRLLARVYHNLGMLYSRMQNYDAALDEFNKCITLSLEYDYLSNCAIAYIGKAYIYTKLKNLELADAFTNKAMEIAYKINDTTAIADIYKIKGMIQSDLENFELSEEFFENSLRLSKDTGSKLTESEGSDELEKLQRKKVEKESKK